MDALKGGAFPDAITTASPTYTLGVKYPRKRTFNYSLPYKYLQAVIDKAGNSQNIKCFAVLDMIPVLTPDGIMFQTTFSANNISNPTYKPCMQIKINHLEVYMIDGLWYLEGVDVHIGPSTPDPKSTPYHGQTSIYRRINNDMFICLLYAVGHYDNVGDEE